MWRLISFLHYGLENTKYCEDCHKCSPRPFHTVTFNSAGHLHVLTPLSFLNSVCPKWNYLTFSCEGGYQLLIVLFR